MSGRRASGNEKIHFITFLWKRAALVRCRADPLASRESFLTFIKRHFSPAVARRFCAFEHIASTFGFVLPVANGDRGAILSFSFKQRFQETESNPARAFKGPIAAAEFKATSAAIFSRLQSQFQSFPHRSLFSVLQSHDGLNGAIYFIGADSSGSSCFRSIPSSPCVDKNALRELLVVFSVASKTLCAATRKRAAPRRPVADHSSSARGSCPSTCLVSLL